MKDYTSYNYSERNGTPIDTIIIHHTDGSFPGCAEWMCNPASKVSAHFIIKRDGDIIRLVEDVKAAWHSGSRKWNRRSIGIELETPKGQTDYTGQQMLALRLLVDGLRSAYDIPPEGVLGHKEVAPRRKTDPSMDMDRFRESLRFIRKDSV